MHISQKSGIKARFRIIKRPSEIVGSNFSMWEIEVLRGVLWERIKFEGGRLCFTTEEECRSFIDEHKNELFDYDSIGVERTDGTEIIDEIVVLED